MPFLKRILLFFLFSLSGTLVASDLKDELSRLPGITIKQINNISFREYYEIFIDQPLDHFAASSATFKQRLILGIAANDSSVVMDTDGYGIDYALNPDYKHELASFIHSNLLLVEHRFFGCSVPDNFNYRYLDTKQSAADIHAIRKLFSGIFKNKWISSGISKGGQAALAHKMYYPEDVSFTLLYGTPVRKKQNDNRIDSMLNELSHTECGKQLETVQKNLLENKKQFLAYLDLYALKNGLTFFMGKETVFEYMVLELPFSFWQSAGNCSMLPAADEESLWKFLIKVIPPAFYSESNIKRLRPAYYMNYHEFGYYEYRTEDLQVLLKQKKYLNSRFVPADTWIVFDPEYINSLNSFLMTEEAENIVFVYGELDPWSAMRATGKAGKLIVKQGSHKSRIADLDKDQKEKLMSLLKFF
jgi:hypothetical protein